MIKLLMLLMIISLAILILFIFCSIKLAKICDESNLK